MQEDPKLTEEAGGAGRRSSVAGGRREQLIAAAENHADPSALLAFVELHVRVLSLPLNCSRPLARGSDAARALGGAAASLMYSAAAAVGRRTRTSSTLPSFCKRCGAATSAGSGRGCTG
eukprot:COSAG01_NODE_1661_length_9583_cov_37.367356_7_plen_119_part_00